MLPVLMEKGSSRGVSSLLRPNTASPPPASQAAAWGEEEEEMKVQVFRPKFRGLLSALVLAELRQKSHPCLRLSSSHLIAPQTWEAGAGAALGQERIEPLAPPWPCFSGTAGSLTAFRAEGWVQARCFSQ